MKNILILFIYSFLISSCSSLGNRIAHEKDAIAIQADIIVYNDLLLQIEAEENREFPNLPHVSKMPVYYKTSAAYFKTPVFPYKNRPENLWNKINPTQQNWWAFFNNTDWKKLREQKLTGPIGKHVLTTYRAAGAGWDTFQRLTVSPIVYSADKTLAMCMVDVFDSPEAGEGILYILEYKNGKWLIIRSTGLYMS